LIRDADKIDIWKVVTEYYAVRHLRRNPALELDLPDTPEYNPEIMKELFENRIPDILKLNTLNDAKLLQIGWVFDVNFQPTFRILKGKRFLDSLFEHLSPTEELQQLRDHINRFLAEKLLLIKK
jgi:hypothetical protein